MTRGCLAAILLSLASFPASAADATTCGSVEMPRQKADEETIKRIESAWLTAEFRGNVDYLDCLLDPGYRVITTRTGETRSKADLLEQVARSKRKTPDVPPLSTAVVVNGSFATAYSSMTGKKANGEAYEARFVDSYFFRNGVWHAIGGVDL